ncbi:hypothetical protein Q0812_01100 [Brevundimonas sp. 2R-24]|uniref:Secreted protein n=1 Tax=Peiella sedimenti TaxID=3061083 RepID=A0ABT8SK56_9CAUL|nr:hypothetical protein [Caulobacteraceae bacterium XZ-24]
MTRRQIPLAVSGLALAFVLAGCEAEPAPPTTVEPVPGTQPAPEPAGEQAPQDRPDPSMAWVLNDTSQLAVYGPPQSEGVLSVGCEGSGGAARLVLRRYTAAAADAQGQIRLSSGGRSATLPASAEATQLGPDYIWRGETAPDSEAAALLAQTETPITVEAPQGPSLTVPAAEALRRAVTACR